MLIVIKFIPNNSGILNGGLLGLDGVIFCLICIDIIHSHCSTIHLISILCMWYWILEKKIEAKKKISIWRNKSERNLLEQDKSTNFLLWKQKKSDINTREHMNRIYFMSARTNLCHLFWNTSMNTKCKKLFCVQRTNIVSYRHDFYRIYWLYWYDIVNTYAKIPRAQNIVQQFVVYNTILQLNV